MKTIEIKVYSFDELEDSAKEKAREWYREGALDYEWWEFIYGDAENAGIEITEFDLGGRKHIKGKLTVPALESADAIIADHGKDCGTRKTAEQFRKALLDYANDEDGEVENPADEYLQAILEDYFVMLDHEYEYLLSDENVDEAIRANEYTFLENGERSKW